MKTYVRVQDGKILEGPRTLPTSWMNISNFNALADADLPQFGWFPYRFVKSPDYGNPDKMLVKSTFEFTDTEVVEYQNMTDKSDEIKLAEIDSMWKSIRVERDGLLSKSDWTQIPDCTVPNKEEWAAYRQALRDLPDSLESPYDVVWPTPPSS